MVSIEALLIYCMVDNMEAYYFKTSDVPGDFLKIKYAKVDIHIQPE